MRIMTKNILEDNSSISMTNADANYPVANVYSNILEEIVQASASSSIITFTFSEDQVVNSLFFGYHNASIVAYNFKDSTGAIIVGYLDSSPNQNAKKYFDQLTNVRSIDVIIISASSSMFIGNLACGVYTEIHNPVLPITVEHVDTTIVGETEGAQFLYRKGVKLKTFSITSQRNEDDWFEEFETASDNTNPGKTWWMDRYEDLPHSEPIFGVFDGNYSESRTNKLTNYTFQFKESK